ncbi:MAG: hypothetical protein K0R08_1329 [Solimicrobium sp.]|jgi:hypothetical protein|nr:hypothetical protein [Solimicrobium sp.]
MKALNTFIFLSAFAVQANAQETQSSTVCKQPVAPNAQASSLVVKSFNKRFDEYKACTKNYIDEQRAIEKKYAEQSIAAHNAAEAMVKKFNDFIILLNNRNKQVTGNEEEDSTPLK